MIPTFGELPPGAMAIPRGRRRRVPIVSATAFPGEVLAFRPRVPSFTELPPGVQFRPRIPLLGQGDEDEGPRPSAPGVVERWRREEGPPVPEGYRMLPSGELVPLDALGPPTLYMGELAALGRPRRRRRGGFGEFLRHGGIIGWIGRQQIVRKVLPRPITAAMRLEFEKIPGALKREFLEPAKPLTGLFAATKKRRRPLEEAPQMIDTALLPTPQPEVPSRPARGIVNPGDFAPASYSPAAQMWGDVPPDMPSAEAMMAPEMPSAEAYGPPQELVPGEEEYAYPTLPTEIMPTARPSVWTTQSEAEMLPMPGTELVAPPPSPEEMQAVEEEAMGLGQARYWWQPTRPDPFLGEHYYAVPSFGPGARRAYRGLAADPAGPEWLRTTARAIAAAAPAVARVIAPEEYFPTGAPAVALPPPMPAGAPAAGAMPGWIWIAGGVVLLGGMWVMMAPPRRRS